MVAEIFSTLISFFRNLRLIYGGPAILLCSFNLNWPSQTSCDEMAAFLFMKFVKTYKNTREWCLKVTT